jgi:RimJ/RimL family protein N-acetyltransferase
MGMLEGKTVNLRVIEKEDVDFQFACYNQMDFWGEYTHPVVEQVPKWGLMREIENPNDFRKALEDKVFIVEKKGGTKIGLMWHFTSQPYGTIEFACFLVPSERGKGYGAEATQLIVDNLFIYRNIESIQAKANLENKAAQRVLEKAGFKAEGTIRKLSFVRGEWKEPKILSRTE